MKVVETSHAPGVIGPYSQGFVVNGFAFTSADLDDAVEIEYDCKSKTSSEKGYLCDAAVAGGSRYMVCTVPA